MITQARLKELLHYEPETGVFTWRLNTSNRVHVGDTAGYSDAEGYIVFRVDRVAYKAHRLAWLYVHGEFPQDQIDHVDRVKSNNAILNLRVVTCKQNKENTDTRSDNKSGFTGVTWHKRDSRWTAQIGHRRKLISLGYFDTPEEASAAYEAMRDKLFTHHKSSLACNPDS